MTVILTNNVYSTLAADLASGAGSLVVTNADRFPVLSAGDYCYATLIAPNGVVEIVKVISRTGTALGITRAQEGTNAMAFPAGSRVELRVTARSVLDAVDDGVAEMTVVTNALDARLDAAEANIITLDGRLDTAEANITALDARLDVAEPEIDALQAFDTTLGTSAGSNSVGFLQAGTGAVARTVQGKLRDIVNVKDFGAVGNGIANDGPAIQAAIDSLTSGGTVIVPQGTYLCNAQIVHKSNVDVIGTGGSVIKKGFNGNLWGIAVSGAELRDLYFNGDHGTYTGKGVVCSGGAACWRPVFDNVVFEAFTDSHIEFAIDSGESAIVNNCRFSPGTGQTDARYIFFNGPDTGAMFRVVSNCTCELGYIDINGAQDVIIANSVFRRIETDAACELIFIQGVRWGNLNNPITIYGNTHVVNCSLSGDVTLDSTFGGVYVGNQQSFGTFTNNALGSTVIARDGAGGTNYMLGRLAAYYLPSGTERIQTGRMANVASTSQTLTVGGSARTVNVTGPLTGNIAYTLSTSNAINGDRFRVVRATSATGAFTIDVGGLKSLSVGQWCDVEFNGSTWYLTAFGSL